MEHAKWCEWIKWRLMTICDDCEMPEDMVIYVKTVGMTDKPSLFAGAGKLMRFECQACGKRWRSDGKPDPDNEF